MTNSKPHFMQGVFLFEGKGFDQPPLRVVEDLDGGTQLELHLAAASGSAASWSSTSAWWRSR